MCIHTHKTSVCPQILSLVALITPNILCTFLFLSSLTINNFKYFIQTAPKYMHTFQISHDAFISQRHFFKKKLMLFYRYSIIECLSIIYEETSISLQAFGRILAEKNR